MLSVLIPIYNYNAFPLVEELHKQCLQSGIPFEILCQDDASFSKLNEDNEKINTLQNSSFQLNNINSGRGGNINSLAGKSQFEWLLIMDCDTIPTQNNFIEKYITQIKLKEKIVFGGIEYQKNKPSNESILRWIYGKKRESLSVEKRNSNHNENALTSNILIQKELFLSNPFHETITQYGYEDLVFLSELKKDVLVKHIDNSSYHLGLETSKEFLEKTKIALKNLKSISKIKSIHSSESKILRTYSILKSLCLISVVSFLFNKTQGNIETNLLSKKPSLLLFDCFKLGYFCSIK